MQSATRPFGRGHLSRKVNRRYSDLTRATRLESLPRHRQRSHRVLWLVFAPSRRGGTDKDRNLPNMVDLPKVRSSAGFKA
jgi:hypothetical protein